MALYKQIETSTGTIGSYWKISDVQIDYVRKMGTFALMCYISKETRDANKQPVNSMGFAFDAEIKRDFDFPFYDENVNILQTLYNLAKTHPFFEGCGDC
jgi:hypothetical protein